MKAAFIKETGPPEKIVIGELPERGVDHLAVPRLIHHRARRR